MVDLEVVGRHAMLFDDDANAVFVNSEEALVDWNSLLIDRYDVRHLLSSPPPPRNRRRQAVPHDDASIATELDRERYLDLPSDEQEQDVNEEVVPVADVGYRAVGFSYGNPDEVNEQKNNDVESVYRPPFPVPESLIQNLPPTEKVHQIIARTATFVSEHGGQSEIVLRVKQGDNPTFGFLMPDHHLHPYFRFLVDNQELLKSNGDGKQEKPGSNIPGQTSGALSLLGSVYGYEEEEDGAAEDLPGINKSQENVDTVRATVSHGSESSGNAAVKNEILSNNNMKEKVSAIKRNPSINSVKSVAASAEKRNGDIAESAGTSTTKTQTPALPPSIAKVELPVLEPPSELKRVVEKIVEFILRNGKEFEAVLAEQDRKFGRFPFLLPSNQYHSYYLQTLQKTQDQSKLASKASSSEKHESTSHAREKKTSRRDVGTLSTGIADGDIPNDYDRKEKFKMALSKSKKNEQDPPSKIKPPPPPPPEIVIDAEAAAAILKAATRGVKDPALETFPKQAHTNVEDRSSNVMSQTQSFIRNKIAIGEPSVSALAANAMAETAARAAASAADSSEASLTKEQKLKAERLKRAKMFAAMIKNGAAPLKPEPIRSLSAEPTVSGVSSSGNEAVNPKVGKEREGSSVPVDVDTSEKIDRSEKKAVDEFNERRSMRSYRSRSKREEERHDNEEDEEDRRDNKQSKKKHRSHRSSRHGGDSYRHRKRHSSSKHGNEKYCDDEDLFSRHRHRHSSSDDDEDDYERRSSKKKRNRYHRSSDDDRDRHRSRSAKRRERGSGKEVELEEGEIGGAKSDQSKTNESRQASREASVDLLKSQPSESTVVPDDLRAKVRAMLMATM